MMREEQLGHETVQYTVDGRTAYGRLSDTDGWYPYRIRVRHRPIRYGYRPVLNRPVTAVSCLTAWCISLHGAVTSRNHQQATNVAQNDFNSAHPYYGAHPYRHPSSKFCRRAPLRCRTFTVDSGRLMVDLA
ncbi:hypothetical protein B0H19DRAFT_1080127 [Mycena capillaripes]|nr:hypothetical protein B0H19DRAFT_1080127 [Mycena capillaripes]